MITLADIDRMRQSAHAADANAARARDLARAIDHRRSAVHQRIDHPSALHTADVWSSAAATRSRVELISTVGGAIRLLGEELRLTSMLLDAQVGVFEADARSLRRRAAAAEARLAQEG